MNKGWAETRAAVRRDSFVIRIWQEESGRRWRGWVQHSQTGESSPIHSLDGLVAFVQDRAGKLDGPHRQGLK